MPFKRILNTVWTYKEQVIGVLNAINIEHIFYFNTMIMSFKCNIKISVIIQVKCVTC